MGVGSLLKREARLLTLSRRMTGGVNGSAEISSLELRMMTMRKARSSRTRPQPVRKDSSRWSCSRKPCWDQQQTTQPKGSREQRLPPKASAPPSKRRNGCQATAPLTGPSLPLTGVATDAANANAPVGQSTCIPSYSRSVFICFIHLVRPCILCCLSLTLSQHPHKTKRSRTSRWRTTGRAITRVCTTGSAKPRRSLSLKHHYK